MFQFQLFKFIYFVSMCLCVWEHTRHTPHMEVVNLLGVKHLIPPYGIQDSPGNQTQVVRGLYPLSHLTDHIKAYPSVPFNTL